MGDKIELSLDISSIGGQWQALVTYRFVAHGGELLIGIAQIAIGVAHKVCRVPGDRVGDDLLVLDGTSHDGNAIEGVSTGVNRQRAAQGSARGVTSKS